VERVRPHRPNGHGESWQVLLGEEQRIQDWVEEGLTVVKIGILLSAPQIEPHECHGGWNYTMVPSQNRTSLTWPP
jgi:hypothetical protein